MKNMQTTMPRFQTPTRKQVASCVEYLRGERDRLKALGMRQKKPSPCGPLAFALGLAAEWLNTAREREQSHQATFRRKT